MGKTAIYPGFFDPFTNGHLDIVRKAAEIFDRVYVVIGVNAEKHRTFPAERIAQAITRTLQENQIENCQVVIWNGLVAEFARQQKTDYMIRGLRNNMDYNYEENVACVNKLIFPELEYIYFRSNNVAVSSTMVKELSSYGKDVSQYVPGPVLELLGGNDRQ